MVLRIAPCTPLLPQFPHFDGEANTYFPTPIPSCTCKSSKLKQHSVLGNVALKVGDELGRLANVQLSVFTLGSLFTTDFLRSNHLELVCLFIFCSSSHVTEQPSAVLRDWWENNHTRCFPTELSWVPPPRVILSKGDGDPSGGWPDVTIRGRNSLSSSFHIY